MADSAPQPAKTPSLEEMQHWTWVFGRAQQMMLEQGLEMIEAVPSAPLIPGLFDPTAAIRATAGLWADTMQLWQRFVDPEHAPPFAETPEQARDKRFKAREWREEPIFDFLRQSYFVIADNLLKGVDAIEGVDEKHASSCASRPRASSMR